MTYKRSVRRRRRHLKGGISRRQALALRRKFIALRKNVKGGGDPFVKRAFEKQQIETFKKALKI